MIKRSLLALAILVAAASPSAAQLPDLGGTVGGLTDPLREVPGAAQELTNTAVRDLRQARARAARLLQRQHPSLIDSDRGAPIVRNEVIAIAPSPAALEDARRAGFSVVETVDGNALGVSIVVLRAPPGLNTRRALERLRALDPEGAYDFNHIYLGAGDSPRILRQSGGGGDASVRIGLIDSGLDARHPAFQGAQIHQRGFAGAALPALHGSAVASLLLSAAPGASIYVADVYGGRPTGGGAAAIVAALAWLVEQRVGVINISLVGPPNRALEASVRAAIARGCLIVAAVGNDGPNAPPLYPAAYAGVIGVTGVDPRRRALPEALRGAQVDFAAPGAQLTAAAADNRYAPMRGTSFAAPIVAGVFARRHPGPDGARAERLQAAFAGEAHDLGAPGRDNTFGFGLIGADIAGAQVARR